MLALCGCAGDEPDPGDLAFDYRSLGGDSQIDQFLSLTHEADVGLAPSIEITPLDGEGEKIPGVKAHTAFGSDRGRVVIPPEGIVSDVLRFSGPRARDVEDVELQVTSLEEADAEPAPEELDTKRMANGRPVKDGVLFDAYRIDNPNPGEATVRVALIEWEDPPEGKPQQAARVTPLSSLLRVPGKGSRTVRMPPELRKRVIGSVKAYYSR